MANHFATNVPGTNPTRWSGNPPSAQNAELTEQRLIDVIREGVESYGNQLNNLSNQLQSIVEKQRQLSAGIAEIEADQKARGIYREPGQALAGNHSTTPNQLPQWNAAAQDTLPD